MATFVRSKILLPLAVAALLVLHVGLALWAAAGESVTADEILHVTGGYFYDRYGDFRIQPENGVLPQRLAGLPAWLMDAPPPPLADNVYWRTSDAPVVGHQFFYETHHDHWPMLMAARTVLAVCSAATGLLIFYWSRRLWGTAGALLSLTLFALCPNFLAHDALATSDSLAVFFLLAATSTWWHHLQTMTLRSGALSALTLGLTCVAKYSFVLLVPVFALLLASHVAREPLSRRSRWLRFVALSIAGHVASAWAIIWACYGFRYGAFAPGVPPASHFIAPWEIVLSSIGWQGPVVDFCRHWRLLPEAFLYGYAWVVHSVEARAAFLAGNYSVHGWPSFFPLAFLWKTPLAVLAASAAGLGLLVWRWSRAPRMLGADLARVAPLAALFVVYWAFSLTSHLNIGHRHILPTYPVVFILVGGLVAVPELARTGRIMVFSGLTFTQAAATVRSYPHFLAFFNTLAGGPANGWRLLVDSSLDWGQDLPSLKKWLATNAPTEPVFLSYFGSGEPDYYGIRAERLPFVNGFKIVRRHVHLSAGVYCISATTLQQVYSPVNGDWTIEHETEFQQLRMLEPLLFAFQDDPARRAELLRDVPEEKWTSAWARYDHLRFARLCGYLRLRRPDAVIGYSIFIHRLSPAEVADATAGSLADWQALVEKAAKTKP